MTKKQSYDPRLDARIKSNYEEALEEVTLTDRRAEPELKLVGHLGRAIVFALLAIADAVNDLDPRYH